MIFLYIIFLSKEFFNGADIDIEVKAKVIYESDTKDIINQYIIFCKVLDEQRKVRNDGAGYQRNNQNLQRQECIKRIFGVQRNGGCDDYDEFI